ncbi:hypothetical protein IWW38_004200 [Coemansia aciculifera]|uniref:Uncharacterized protein n=1 Tax=Coemansia aciculifera TaxID=417176 RepID=A0ACC1LYY9_9FUNG|nr:hypothetical protein IWW38_004200 [Coemansia aciculifera]
MHLPSLHSKMLQMLEPKFMHGYTSRDMGRVGERARQVVKAMGQQGGEGMELTSGDIEVLLRCFKHDMEAVDQIWQFAVLSGVVREVACFDCFLNIKMFGRQYERAFKVVEEMKEAGLRPTEYTQTCLVRLYGLTGDLVAARRVFHELSDNSSSPSIYAYNAMLDVLGMNGLVEEMRHMFLQAVGLGDFIGRDLSELEPPPTDAKRGLALSPNRETFHVLIKWHAVYWDVDRATQYVRVMNDVFGVRPVARTLKVLVTEKTAVREFQKCAEAAVMMSERYGVVPPGFVVRTLEAAKEKLAAMEKKVQEAEAQRSSIFAGLF